MQVDRSAAVILAGLALLSATPVSAASFKLLYTFEGSTGKGPHGPLTFDARGNLYGVATGGGTEDGSIFKINPKSGVLATLHKFTGTSDGSTPGSGLVPTSPDIMYGLTNSGGKFGHGTIFHIDLKTNKVAVDYHFPDATSGTGFNFPMIVGKNHILYGTAPLGGPGPTSACGVVGCGTVFTFDPVTKTVTVLHAFLDGGDGDIPEGGLFVSTDGNYYGVAAEGGTLGGGVIYKIDSATNAFSVVHAFNRTSGPSDPQGQLVAGSNGIFYGTTVEDAEGPPSDLYSFDPATGQLDVLHQFDVGTEGDEPTVGLARSTSGDLCGATSANGPHGYGAVFCYDPVSSVSKVIKAITAKKTGASSSPLVAGPLNALYGTMSDIGSTGFTTAAYGTVFAIRP